MIKKEKTKIKLGSRALKKKKNPFLNRNGGFDLIDKFPGIDFMIYEKERIKKQKRGD